VEDVEEEDGVCFELWCRYVIIAVVAGHKGFMINEYPARAQVCIFSRRDPLVFRLASLAIMVQQTCTYAPLACIHKLHLPNNHVNTCKELLRSPAQGSV
jgi:hypothetical protein